MAKVKAIDPVKVQQAEIISAKIDKLSEFCSKRDSLQHEKNLMMNETNVPKDVAEQMHLGNLAIQNVDAEFGPEMDKALDLFEAEMSSIQIPLEVIEILAKVDKERAEIRAREQSYRVDIETRKSARKSAIQRDVDDKVGDIFRDIEQKRRDIEAEFYGKGEVVARNIAALDAEIKQDVLAHGETVKGQHKMYLWVKGREGTWMTDKLKGIAEIFPQILTCKNPDGDPSVTVRDI